MASQRCVVRLSIERPHGCQSAKRIPRSLRHRAPIGRTVGAATLSVCSPGRERHMKSNMLRLLGVLLAALVLLSGLPEAVRARDWPATLVGTAYRPMRAVTAMAAGPNGSVLMWMPQERRVGVVPPPTGVQAERPVGIRSLNPGPHLMAVNRLGSLLVVEGQWLWILDASGEEQRRFPIPRAESIGVLANDDIVVSAVANDRLIHVFSSLFNGSRRLIGDDPIFRTCTNFDLLA